MLRALETIFPDVAYNFVLHTSPFAPCWDQVFHWRMEIFPRLTKVAGFEWGSDCFINPVLPEFAAKELAKWA
jgi:UDPglucose--hexose-1-phosphate uridylyltransferase